MSKEIQEQILNLTDQILLDALEYISRNGSFTDVEDMDGKGGTKTQRLSNVTGLGEIRMIRSTVRKELGLDLVPGVSAPENGTSGSMPILTLLQSGNFPLQELRKLGGVDND